MKPLLYALPLAVILCGTARADDPSPAMQQEARGMIAACRLDYLRYCGNLRPGGGRVLACLAAQPAQNLSPACRAVLPRAQALLSDAKASGALPQ